jgi:hypothetical protein
MVIEAKIVSRTRALCDRRRGMREKLKQYITQRRRRLIDEAFSAVLDYKMHQVDTASYIAERKRDGSIPEESLFYPLFERQIAEMPAVPLDEVRDVLKISEERHQKLIANWAALFAGLIGGGVGATLTYLLTKAPGAGLGP